MAKTYTNIYGNAYGEDRDAFVQTYTIEAEDQFGDTVHLNAIHQTVVIDETLRDDINYRCGTFSEALFIFGEDFFDDGVLASCIEPICSGWDHGDFAGVLYDLVISVVLDGREADLDIRRKISDSITLYETNDGRNDTVHSASLLYGDLVRLIDSPTARRARAAKAKCA